LNFAILPLEVILIVVWKASWVGHRSQMKYSKPCQCLATTIAIQWSSLILALLYIHTICVFVP